MMYSTSIFARAGLRLVAASLLFLLCAWQGVAAQGAKASDVKGREKFAKVDGMRVHYESFGRGNEALVFVHGWTCDLTFWRRQLPAFASKTRVLALDLPGHGRSDKPQLAYTMDLFARAVEAVMRDAKVKRAVLVGHSMGAPVIRQFYRKFPEKTLALVLVDGALHPFAPRAVVMEQWIAPMRGPGYREGAARMVDGLLQPVKSQALREEIRSKMLSAPQHVAVSAMEGMADDAIWREDKVSVPVLAVLARSPFWPADNEQRFRRVAPDLEYRMWDDVSHFLMMDKPEEFNRELSDFLTRRKLLVGKS